MSKVTSHLSIARHLQWVIVPRSKRVLIFPKHRFPSAIQSIKIDPASLTFYDNEYSLFAWDNKEDTVSALNTAQSDVETKMNRTELLERADMQARKAIEDMLKGLTYGREGYNVDVSVVPRPEL